MSNILIIGSGLTGATLAEQAARKGHRVTVIEQRPHLAGNCYDERRELDILVSLYGAHLFHTNNQRVWDYLQQFATWRPHEHQVLARVDGQLINLPVNINTVNQLFGLRLKTAQEMRAFLAKQALPIKKIKTSADYVLAELGTVIYEKLFRDYSQKQWALDPSMLDRSVISRLSVRYNHDNRYFTDRWQALPVAGYTKLIEKMLDQPNIDLQLNTDFFSLTDRFKQSFDKIFYTGAIDRYFDYCYGKLEYRSLKFDFETHQLEYFQENSVINYPSLDVAYTRILEFKYFNPPSKPIKKTIIAKEYPQSEGEAYYPIPRERNWAIMAKYQSEAKKLAKIGVYFAGRLGSYRYLNMDQAVAEALKLAQILL